MDVVIKLDAEVRAQKFWNSNVSSFTTWKETTNECFLTYLTTLDMKCNWLRPLLDSRDICVTKRTAFYFWSQINYSNYFPQILTYFLSAPWRRINGSRKNWEVPHYVCMMVAAFICNWKIPDTLCGQQWHNGHLLRLLPFIDRHDQLNKLAKRHSPSLDAAFQSSSLKEGQTLLNDAFRGFTQLLQENTTRLH